MRVLGLDLSLTSTGYVLLDEDQVIWFGSVAPKSRDVDRLAEFDEWVRLRALPMFSTKCGESPSAWFTGSVPASEGGWHVGIEGYSFASQFRGPQLGELGGVVKLAIHQAGVPITIIPPATWKKTLCGKGNLDKRNASVEISRRYNVNFASEDTLDAWAVAMCLRRQLLGLDKPEPKVRKRKVSAGNQLHIPATEEAHDEARTTSARLAAGTSPAGPLAGG
jgi:hypothetical protein